MPRKRRRFVESGDVVLDSSRGRGWTPRRPGAIFAEPGREEIAQEPRAFSLNGAANASQTARSVEIVTDCGCLLDLYSQRPIACGEGKVKVEASAQSGRAFPRRQAYGRQWKGGDSVTMRVLLPMSGLVLVVAAIAHGESRLGILPDGRLAFNGEPFFTIGTYDSIGRERSPNAPRFTVEQVPETEAVLRRFRGMGFNVIRYIPWHGYQRVRDRALLDLCHSVGLKTWWSVQSPKYAGTTRDLCTHPALLFYEIADEPAWKKQAVAPLVERYEFIRGLDPNHPVFLNHAPRNSLAQLKPYNRACDMLGVDIYPVPEGNGHSHLPNQATSCVGDYAEWVRAAGEDRKPVLMVLQACAFGTPEGKDPVYPTWEQLRFMAFDAIVHGAVGVLYWGLNSVPEEALLWGHMRRVVGELARLEPVLAAPDSTHRLWCAARVAEGEAVPGRGVKLTIREAPEGTYVLAVNEESYAVTGAVEGVDWGVSEVEVLGEDRRITVDAERGEWEDAWSGYGVHVYRLVIDDRAADDRPRQ